MTYAEYLKKQGASEEDVKLLDTAINRKMYTEFEAAQASAIEERTKRENYAAEVGRWNDEQITPMFETLRGESASIKAKNDAMVAAIRNTTDAALKKVAKDMGYPVDDANPNPNPNPNLNPAFDAAKYVSKDEFLGVADRVGGTLAEMQDLVSEHMQLFPNQRLDMRTLRAEAVAAKKGVFEYWESKYKVSEARTAQAAAARKREDDTIREETRRAVETEFASKYGDPNMRPLTPSNHPLAPRHEGPRAALPWVVNGVAVHDAPSRSMERVQRATTAILKQGVH